MIRKIDRIEFQELVRISPSQYTTMLSCSYRAVLSCAMRIEQVLPISANAYFGIVAHRILEEIERGLIANVEQFEVRFSFQLSLVEADLKARGLNFLLPLQNRVHDFGLKKTLLKRHIGRERKGFYSQRKCYPEKWFQSKDGLIGGKLDLVIVSKNNVEIIDFKTGKVVDESWDDQDNTCHEIKKEYQDQLKLYAYLYYENTGDFPDALSIVDMMRQKYSVRFSFEECRRLFVEAKSMLVSINEGIRERSFKAEPSESRCKYCLFRPACTFYLDFLSLNEHSSDFVGTLQDVVIYLNGSVTLILVHGNTSYRIIGLPKECYDLIQSKGSRIGLFNLRKGVSECVYSATKSTIIYEY